MAPVISAYLRAAAKLCARSHLSRGALLRPAAAAAAASLEAVVAVVAVVVVVVVVVIVRVTYRSPG